MLLHFKLLNVRGPATGGLEVKVAESNAADVKRQIDELDKKLGECRIELAAKRKIWASNHPKLQMLIREVDALQARRDELAEPGGR